MLRGDVKDVLLLDVTPLSLGIETKGGVMTKLIERNTTIPTKRTEVFTTADDMQPSVEIHVLQGEREMAGYNKTLGKFQLVDLPPAPAWRPADRGHLRHRRQRHRARVSAKDRATGKEQSMTITGQSTLDKKDIDQMVRDAEAHAEDDRKRREEAEIRNNADSLVYQMEKVLRDNADKVDAAEKATVEGPLAELKTALAGNDIDAIRAGAREADGGQPGVQPEAVRVRGPRRERRRNVCVGSADRWRHDEQRRRHRRCRDCGRSVSDVSSRRPESEGPVTGEDPPTSPTARGPLLPPAPPSDSSLRLSSNRRSASDGRA